MLDTSLARFRTSMAIFNDEMTLSRRFGSLVSASMTKGQPDLEGCRGRSVATEKQTLGWVRAAVETSELSLSRLPLHRFHGSGMRLYVHVMKESLLVPGKKCSHQWKENSPLTVESSPAHFRGLVGNSKGSTIDGFGCRRVHETDEPSMGLSRNFPRWDCKPQHSGGERRDRGGGEAKKWAVLKPQGSREKSLGDASGPLRPPALVSVVAIFWKED